MDQTHTGQRYLREDAKPEPNNHSVLSNFMSQFLCHPLCLSGHSNAFDSWSYKWKERLPKVHNSYSWGWGNGLRIIMRFASPDLCDRSHINYHAGSSRKGDYLSLCRYSWNTILAIKKEVSFSTWRNWRTEEIRVCFFKNRVKTGGHRTNESPKQFQFQYFLLKKRLLKKISDNCPVNKKA